MLLLKKQSRRSTCTEKRKLLPDLKDVPELIRGEAMERDKIKIKTRNKCKNCMQKIVQNQKIYCYQNENKRKAKRGIRDENAMKKKN